MSNEASGKKISRSWRTAPTSTSTHVSRYDFSHATINSEVGL